MYGQAINPSSFLSRRKIELQYSPVYTKVINAPYELHESLRQYLTRSEWDYQRKEAVYHSNYRDSRFPSGLLQYVLKFFRMSGIDYSVTTSCNESYPKRDVLSDNFKPYILNDELHDYQHSSAMTALQCGRGTLSMATGSGKTHTAAGMLKYLDRPSLFIVDRLLLAEQTLKVFKKVGLDDVGFLGGGTDESDSKIVVSMIQTLWARKNDKKVKRFLDSREVLFLDELHRGSSQSWVGTTDNIPAPYRYGLSGTPFEDRDKLSHRDMILMGITGDIVCDIPIWWLINQGFIPRPRIIFLDTKSSIVQDVDHQQSYREGIVECNDRNEKILDILTNGYHAGKKIFLLVLRIKHGKYLQKALAERKIESIFSYGGKNYSESDLEDPANVNSILQETTNAVDDFKNRKAPAIFIGSMIYSYGVDLPPVDWFINAAGGRKKHTERQVLGRCSRLSSNREGVTFLDFYDSHNSRLKLHSESRRSALAEDHHTIWDITDVGEFLELSEPPRDKNK